MPDLLHLFFIRFTHDLVESCWCTLLWVVIQIGDFVSRCLLCLYPSQIDLK